MSSEKPRKTMRAKRSKAASTPSQTGPSVTFATMALQPGLQASSNAIPGGLAPTTPSPSSVSQPTDAVSPLQRANAANVSAMVASFESKANSTAPAPPSRSPATPAASATAMDESEDGVLVPPADAKVHPSEADHSSDDESDESDDEPPENDPFAALDASSTVVHKSVTDDDVMAARKSYVALPGWHRGSRTLADLAHPHLFQPTSTGSSATQALRSMRASTSPPSQQSPPSLDKLMSLLSQLEQAKSFFATMLPAATPTPSGPLASQSSTASK